MNKLYEKQCPFVYANGRRCNGHISGLRDYVDHGELKKVRFWCSDKHDHAGVDASCAAKHRMEFYPDQVADDLRQEVFLLLKQDGYQIHGGVNA